VREGRSAASLASASLLRFSTPVRSASGSGLQAGCEGCSRW
jgi:hypothetical protein